MAFLIIVLMLLGWAFAILGLGVFIHGLINDPQSDGAHRSKQEIEFTICGFLGLVGYSLLAACLNFAVPIDNHVSFCLMFIGWGLVVAKRRAAFLWLKKSHIVVAAMVFGYICVIPLTPVINHDTGLYHLQTIKWFVQEPLVPGLANLHDRFGFNSMWLTFAALVDLPPKLFASPNFISNSLAMFFYGVGIFLSLKICFEGDTSLSNLFMALTAVPWLSKVANFMNSPSPDLPVMLVTFLIIYLLILSLERPASRSVCLSLATILSAFAVSVKLVAAPLLLFVGGWCVVDFCGARLTRQGFVSIAKRIDKSAARDPIPIALTMASSVVIVWLTRGVFLSGCPAYPSTLGCLQDLKWAVSMECTKQLAELIQGWTRLPGPRFREALNSWSWLSEWWTRNIPQETALVVLFFVGACLLIVGTIRSGGRVVTKDAFLIPALASALGVVFWFLSAPDPRFAYGFLFSLGLLLVAQGALSLSTTFLTSRTGFGKPESKILAVLTVSVLITIFLCRKDSLSALALVAGCVFAVLSAVPLRTNQALFWIFCVAMLLNGKVAEGALKVNDWFAWGRFPTVTVGEKVTHQGFIIRNPLDGDQCWNTEVPCAPVPCEPAVAEDLRADIPEPGRYRKFWFEKD